MAGPKRAPRGSASDAVGIFVQLPPEMYDEYVRAAAERGVTRRRLAIAGIRRELTEPTVFADTEQGELPLKTA